MTELVYPIFILSQEGFIDPFDSYDEFNSWVEYVDVLDGEYSGWDYKGRKIKISIINNRLDISIISLNSEMSELKKAIIISTIKNWPENPFKPSKNDLSLNQLSIEVCEHLDKMSIWTRFLKLFC